MNNNSALKAITILLAEDHNMVREGLKALLKSEPDIAIIGEAENGRQAVALAEKLRPAVIVMDIAMPLLNGVEATRQIRKAVPEAKILILSAHSDDTYIEKVTAMGAKGYLLKQSFARYLSEAIRELHKGNTFFSYSIAQRMQQHDGRLSERGKEGKKHANQLSSREVEVLQLVAEGYANKQVAAELGISVKTVEKHRQSLMQKLQIHDTASLTRYAIASGIVESNIQLTIL